MEKTTDQQNKIEEGFIGQKMIVLSPDRIAMIEGNEMGRLLYPTAIGFYPHALHHERDRKTGSEQYILLYCINGKGWIRINGNELTLTPNTCFILPKKTAHSYGSSLKEPWSIYWIHFSGEIADLLYERSGSSENDVSQIPFDSGNINTFNSIFQICDNDLSFREIELMYVKLLQLLSGFMYTHRSHAIDEKDRISASMNNMKNNLEKNFSIKELADSANYSTSRYSELFRERTGYAPIQYFLQLKIQKSCQFLYFSKMTIKEICKEVGFDDQYYFSRMFRKQMNISPMKYRKAHQK